MRTNGFKGCTQIIYKRAVLAATPAWVDPNQVLSGSLRREHVSVRWRVWRDLRSKGFSYFSMGKASGFDHTTVISACRHNREPMTGRKLFKAKDQLMGCR